MGRSGQRSRYAYAVAIAALVGLATPVAGFAQEGGTDQCVADRIAQGETRVQAVAECIRDATDTSDPETTSAPAADPPASTSDDERSPLVLIVVGLAGAAIGGAAGILFLRRRAARPQHPVSGAPAPAVIVAPINAPPPPPPMAVSSPDRSTALVTGLIDLSDRVPSQALRAEVIAMLATAGVRVIDVPPGTPFDASQMRGIGTVPSPDPASQARVASTDRVGFSDGVRVIRAPDVIVFRGE